MDKLSLVHETLNNNTRLINNKYLIFYVRDDDNTTKFVCYGRLPFSQCSQETMSVSSGSSVHTGTEEGSDKDTL
ncbi:late expression factor 10 [Phthorimaea operculella granulovirus]|uniref:Late expression factor 10 n=1 Tax=Phthorimaea operculella granulovirus TaxID=192584 RepID=Q8JRT4_9BBAC|nr:late expression factor 10 [Phthorimaea operculella granulovirus]AAM70323.1 late expression factor 10 [Phthorimaea operculella granulovirus]ANY57514.1 late expression factor 10 [Phthorimaea operculella granulovirus]QBH65960.1 late expression factor 10 [Phthorimaea operculella granulovirus]QBH66090.1 late expression factor 10 [Phthorimaea operculella granulovirus]QBH66220.1 late expression factor 10 [Phthorimaea operculella granulovirus]